MRTRGVLTVALAISALASGATGARHVIAQGAVALNGVASSQEEGKMEGVVVSARRDGANFTVSVVSNAEGRYSFPRSHVEPGTYTVTTRAVGYDLNDPGTVEVTANQATSLDLGLQPTADLAPSERR